MSRGISAVIWALTMSLSQGCAKEPQNQAVSAKPAAVASKQAGAQNTGTHNPETQKQPTLPPAKLSKRGAPGPLKLAMTFNPKLPDRTAETTKAVRKVWAWAKALHPHPQTLRQERNMLGKKHFVEYLALLRVIAAWPDTPDISKQAVARAHDVLKWTDEPAYHDLGELNAALFRRDSMSYLRAALLARRFGWDTGNYMAQIRRVMPLYAEKLPTRGIDQQMAFSVLYAGLGLPGAPTRKSLYPQSRIAKITPFQHWVQSPTVAYDFTHEVFAMTGRGARPFPFLRPIEQKYARKVAHTLLHIHMTEKNHDIVAELLVNRVQLQDATDAQVPVARKFLLGSQDAQGRFGHYDEEKVRKQLKKPNYDVNIGGYLHTTMVALWALMLSS
ncbi:MAG: hypothetical protein KC502_22745 [Myxococcales bacterium]|nr:hypothetical protein [Myxococcales bacterium]